MLLGGAHLACSGQDESQPDSPGPPLESQRLAREKYEQGARIFSEDFDNVANLRSALELFEEAIALDSTLVEAHVGIGRVCRAGIYFGWFEEASNLVKAEARFERAIALDPTHMPAYYGLMLAKTLGLDTEAVLRIGDRARRAGAPGHETRMMRAWTYFFAGFPDLTLILIDNPSPEASTQPSDPERDYLLTLSLACAGKYEAAIRAGNRFLEVFGEEAEIHLWVAISHHCRGDLETARIHYEKSLELLGDNRNLYGSALAGVCYEDLGLIQEAQRVWRESSITLKNRLALVGNNDRLQYYLDVYGILLGDLSEFEIARRNSWSEAGLSFLAGALARRGNTEEAVRIIDQLQSGTVIIRALAPAAGFPDLESSPYRGALQRLENREARLRETYGPL